VTNAGDVEAWPVWTITGPGSGIVLRNLTTGQSMDFGVGALAAGNTVVVDTRPGAKTAVANGSINVFPFLSAASVLWSLQRGANAVRLEMSGAIAGASGLSLAYRPRYLSP
jgi:hypothetical protein